MRLHFFNSEVIGLAIKDSFLSPWGEESSNIFSKFTLFNTDTCYGPLSARIKGVSVT